MIKKELVEISDMVIYAKCVIIFFMTSQIARTIKETLFILYIINK